MSIFRKYDIRGVAQTELTPSFCKSLGSAFAQLLLEKNPQATHVSVGRDARISSDAIFEGLTEGLLESGISVYNLGICPTPLQYFSLYKLPVQGGIMITGSHNPPEYNGFKLSIGRETIYGEEIQKLKQLIQSRGNTMQHKNRGKLIDYDIISSYKDHMLKEFFHLRPEAPRLKVVVDCGNGTAGLVIPSILEALGFETHSLYAEPDGRFPNHHPDPTVVENMNDLKEKVLKEGADLGVGYDGDADRIGIIGPDGSIIWGDQIMIILGREILKRNPSAKIIGDVKCSQTMFDAIKEAGGIPIMWKTGHSLIKAKMREEDAPLAGEFSGHIFIKDRYFGFDDALYTTLRILEVMVTSNKSITDLLSDIPSLSFTPEIRIKTPDDIKHKVIERLVNNLKDMAARGGIPYPLREIQTIDGARVVFEGGWALLRTSNTEPVVVMRVEATSEEMVEKYKDFMESLYRHTITELKTNN